MRIVLILFLVFYLGTFSCNCLYAQLSDSLTKKIDSLFADYDNTHTPGCALAILKDGKIIYKKGYGMSNLDYGIAITPASVFQVGSVSKQFTAAAIVHLSLQGKLSLQDDIRKYIPQVPHFGHTITINHLLHHTSGLRDGMELFSGWRQEDLVREEDILDFVKRQKTLDFLPGQEYGYTNTGYILLALAVKKISGQPLPAYTDSVFFKPLGMDHTLFRDNHGQVITNRTVGYKKDANDQWMSSMPISDHYGAINLYTTVEDLAKWDENFYSKKIGGEKFIEAMLRKGIFNDSTSQSYASGLMLLNYKGHKTVEHSGGALAYSSNIVRFPDEHFSVILFTNNAYTNPNLLSDQVAGLFLKDKTVSKQEKGFITDSILVGGWAGDYIDYNSNYKLQLRYKNGRLLGNNNATLNPISNYSFITPGATTTYSFRGDSQKAELIITTQGLNKRTYQKVKPITLSAGQLSAYEGEFYSPELDVSYKLYVKDSSLWMKRPRYNESKVIPFIENIFTGSYTINADQPRSLTIKFTKDKRNKVTGFFLTTARMRNVYFEKKQGK